MSEVGLREAKKQRTRRALADAAAGLFAEQGYAATTVDQIAAAADVSPRTFFRYFAAKEDVVFVGFDAAYDRWADAFSAGPAGEPLEAALRRATLAVNSAYEARRDDFDLLQRLFAEEPSLGMRALAFDQSAQDRAAVLIATALGLEDADLRPRIVAAAAMGAVRAATAAWAAAGGTSSRAAAIGSAYDVLGGIGALLATPRRAPAGA